jgi:hypothetical protein
MATKMFPLEKSFRYLPAHGNIREPERFAHIMKCPKFRGAVFAPEISRGGARAAGLARRDQLAGCAACQVPPNWVTPFPATSPGSKSPANV